MGGCCVLCGEFEEILLDIEHITEGSGERTAAAISRILRGDRRNLQLLCVVCHRFKSLQGLDAAREAGRIRRPFVRLCKDILHLGKRAALELHIAADEPEA